MLRFCEIRSRCAFLGEPIVEGDHFACHGVYASRTSRLNSEVVEKRYFSVQTDSSHRELHLMHLPHTSTQARVHTEITRWSIYMRSNIYSPECKAVHECFGCRLYTRYDGGERWGEDVDLCLFLLILKLNYATILSTNKAVKLHIRCRCPESI